MKRILSLIIAGGMIASANQIMAQTNSQPAPVRLITLDPGHFHAALIQKFTYPGVDPVVHVYAPGGDDLQEHLKRIESFNTRTNHPTHWDEKVYTGSDFLEKMVEEKAGNVVVISGNNAKKADYILRSVQAGLNVLADKPMVIVPADFEKLQQAFKVAAANHVLLYDIMTERHEITTILQRDFSRRPNLFGELVKGTFDQPAITKESVHHFSKVVAGAPLKRPQWFFDVRQQGEGIVDVTSHLVDLVQWEAFPNQALSVFDVKMLKARRSPTAITRDEFKQVTGANDFPEFLKTDVTNNVLQVFANGEFTYQLRGVYARVSVKWNFEAPPGGGDTHFSIMRGTKANLIIRQGAAQKFKPVLYVEKVGDMDDSSFFSAVQSTVQSMQTLCPGLGFERAGDVYRITVPEVYDVGHEAHFAQVTADYLRYLREGRLPSWEVPNMVTKCATIMQAYEMSRK
jgi:predicted dehydrogenase